VAVVAFDLPAAAGVATGKVVMPPSADADEAFIVDDIDIGLVAEGDDAAIVETTDNAVLPTAPLPRTGSRAFRRGCGLWSSASAIGRETCIADDAAWAPPSP